MQFQLFIYIYIHPFKSLSAETENFLCFFKFKKHNSVKNHRTLTIFKLDLRINIAYPHIKFVMS